MFLIHGGSSGVIPPSNDRGFFAILDIAEELMDVIRDLGDFLFDTPDTLKVFNPIGLIAQLVINSETPIGDSLQFLIDIFGIETYIEIPNVFGSLGGVVIGGGLIFIVGFRVVKFFTDIVL